MLNLFCTVESFKLFKRNQFNFDFFKLAPTCFDSSLFRYRGWTLLSGQTKCSDFLIREKKKLKQFPYSSPSMLHTACFGSWKVAYYSEGHSLPFCGNITVRPAKELKKKKTWRLTLILGHSLGQRCFLPYVSALVGFFFFFFLKSKANDMYNL